MKHFLKLFAARIAVLALLLAVAAAIILYQAGKYDISFIPRETQPAETSMGGETASGVTDTNATETRVPVTGDNISSISDPSSIGGSDTASGESTADEKAALLAAYKDFMNKCPTYAALTAQGWTETGSLFDFASHQLALVTPKTTYTGVYSYRFDTEEYTERVATSLGYETQYLTRNIYRPALKLYMGLIVQDNGDGKYSIYDRWGNLIANSINIFYDVFDRDADGKPIVRYGSKYYSISADGAFREVDYDPDYSKGVVYDAPEYYARSGIKLYPYSEERTIYVMIETDERKNETVTVLSNVPTEKFKAEQQVISSQTEATVQTKKPEETQPPVDPLTGKPVIAPVTDAAITEAEITPELQTEAETEENPPVYEYRTEKLWGFKDENGKVVIDAQYKAVYTFSDNGLAAVVSYRGELLFIDKRNNTVINPYGRIVYLAERDNRQSYDGYYPADTKLVENLGMYYFDHGLVRVRRQLKDNYFKKRVATDSDYVIDKNGAYFDIPENYTLVAYSDGVLTLEKDGLYGYYSYKGNWIAQPIYTVCKPFVQGLGVIGFTGGMCAMIDTEGSIVIPFVFDYISQPSDGVVLAYSKSGGWTELITAGKPA